MIILASASPRRRELLEQLNLPFTVRPCGGDETIPENLPPRELVISIAEQKLKSALSALTISAEDIVITADTLVFLDGTPMRKPRDESDAAAMLRALSGRTHEVCTGVALCRDGTFLSDAEVTRVRFAALREDEIAAYVHSGEPMDKAGAYAIQGCGALLVEQIRGDYYNVVGLPLRLLSQLLRRFGIDAFSYIEKIGVER